MAQITWRNINVPSDASANALFDRGADRISQGIGQLSDLASQYGNQLLAKEQKVTQDNTDLMLARINELGTMEDYNTAMQSGEFSLDTLKNSNVDIGQIQNALMSRDNKIMQDETDMYNYEQAVQSRADAPIMQDLQKQLLGANTVAGVDGILANLSDSGLSEQAQLTVMQKAQQQKQHLLDKEYQSTQRDRESTRWGWDVSDRYDAEKAKFVGKYLPENQLAIRNSISSAETSLGKLDKEYPVPDGFEDQLSLGTSTDAINSYVTSLDNEKIDANAVNNEIMKKLATETFQLKDGSGKVIKEYTYQELPYWVMNQALKTIPIDAERGGFWSTEIGKVDIDSNELSRLVKSIKGNLQSYGIYDSNLKAKKEAQGLYNSQIYAEQLKMLELQKQAEKAYDERNRTTRNM